MELESILSGIENLPPTPQIIPKLRRVLKDEDSGVEEIASLVKLDAALTAQIIRLGNSAYLGAANPSKSIQEAVGRLGFRVIYLMVNLIITKQVLGRSLPIYDMKEGEIWEKSIMSAALMESLATELKEDTDTAYTAGLVHDLGKVAVNQYVTEKEINLGGLNGSGPITPQRERELLGFDSAEAGSTLLKMWSFPTEIYMAVRFQIEPHESPLPNPFACLLYISDWACRGIDYNAEPESWSYDDDRTILEKVNLTEESLFSAISNARTQLDSTNNLLSSV